MATTAPVTESGSAASAVFWRSRSMVVRTCRPGTGSVRGMSSGVPTMRPLASTSIQRIPSRPFNSFSYCSSIPIWPIRSPRW